MRAEQPSKSPSSDETPSQKQDPLERRRLQNRLSQRNHRRKIRDRIAKLQERVIANELRAAAALNGWDQPYSSSPLLPSRHATRQPDDLQVNTRDTSPMTTDPPTPFIQSYNIPQTPLWASDLNLVQAPGWISGDTTYMADGRCFLNENPICYASSEGSVLSTGLQLPMESSGCVESNLMQDLFSTSSSILPSPTPTTSTNITSSTTSTNPSPGAPTNQPLYYVATETALPHILQAMSSISPQTKIIVLIPPEAAPSYPTPPPSILGSNGIEMLSPAQSGISNLTCQCQSQSTHLAPNNVQGIPRWNPSGSFSPGCHSHKISTVPGGNFPGMR